MSLHTPVTHVQCPSCISCERLADWAGIAIEQCTMEQALVMASNWVLAIGALHMPGQYSPSSSGSTSVSSCLSRLTACEHCQKRPSAMHSWTPAWVMCAWRYCHHSGVVALHLSCIMLAGYPYAIATASTAILQTLQTRCMSLESNNGTADACPFNVAYGASSS